MTRSLIDAIFPPRCPFCDEIVLEATVRGVCARCVAATRWLATPITSAHFPAPAWDRATAACRFDGPIVDAIHRLKYNRRTDLAGPLARLMMHSPSPAGIGLGGGGRYDFIIPIPLSHARLRERGYNQSTLLAKQLRKPLHAKVLPTALTRTRSTPPQVGLEQKARLANVQGSFALHASVRDQLGDRTILLVDDVMTTGATLHEAARVLRRAHPQCLDVATIAIA